MGVDGNDWDMLSERVFRSRGNPAKLGVITILLATAGIVNSIIGLWLNGRFDLTSLNAILIVSSLGVVGFFGLFGWGAAFVKQAYYKTINQLNFKESSKKSEFLDPDVVYSKRNGVIGVFMTFGLIAFVASSWPLLAGYFPLTSALIPFFSVAIIILALLGLAAIDAVAALPNLLRIPGKLKDHLQITLLKPDRCGGASSIGDFYFVITLVVVLLGSMIVAISSALVQPAIGLALAIAFGVVAFAVFLIPQLSIRSLLKEEKLTRLEEISMRIERLSEHGDDIDRDELILSFMQVQSLIMLYGEIEKLREFPFETSTLQKVGSTALVPILLQIILVFLNLV